MLAARPAAFDWASLTAALPAAGLHVKHGDTFIAELVQLGVATTQAVRTVADVHCLVRYLQQPTGLEIRRGERVGGTAGGLLDINVNVSTDRDNALASSTSLRVSQHKDRDMMLPLRVGGLENALSSSADDVPRAEVNPRAERACSTLDLYPLPLKP